MKAPLISGAYQARSVIASAQRSVNLYSEENEPDAPFPFTYYDRPGLVQQIAGGTHGSRCSYRASTGNLYEVIGPSVYLTAQASPTWTRTLLGTIPNASTPVYMADNGLVILLVDGSANGWAIDLTTNQFAPVSGQNGAFYGGTSVDYVDTFFLLNRPSTTQWYISLSEVTFANLTGTVTPNTTAAAFDPLDIAAKTGNPDPIQRLIVMHRDIWIIGQITSEVWDNTGAADFTFSPIPGVFLEHGTVAPYSVARQDLTVLWLSQDREGHAMVMMGSPYSAKRISTHAIEQQIQQYETIADAIGYTFQQLGHTFYVLNFPTANATWVYDISQPKNGWAEWTWTDANGGENRHRANNAANVYGVNVCGDWQTGALYMFDTNTYTDANLPIVRRRGWPIMLQEDSRVEYNRFMIDVAVGEFINADADHILLDSNNYALLDSNGNPLTDNNWTLNAYGGVPTLSLRWSDDRGKNWSNPLLQTLGDEGQFDKSMTFNQLGMGRSRVFEAFWAVPAKSAINGGFVYFEKCES